MITVELRSKVDKIWEIFWTEGITGPLESEMKNNLKELNINIRNILGGIKYEFQRN